MNKIAKFIQSNLNKFNLNLIKTQAEKIFPIKNFSIHDGDTIVIKFDSLMNDVMALHIDELDTGDYDVVLTHRSNAKNRTAVVFEKLDTDFKTAQNAIKLFIDSHVKDPIRYI